MPEKRRKFDKEFRARAVRIVAEFRKPNAAPPTTAHDRVTTPFARRAVRERLFGPVVQWACDDPRPSGR